MAPWLAPPELSDGSPSGATEPQDQERTRTMFYLTVVVLGVVLTAIALCKKSHYLAGVSAFSTTTFAIVWPAYRFFSPETFCLLFTVVALARAISSRSTLSRIAFIVSAGTLTVLALRASDWVFLLIFLAAILAAVEGVRRTTRMKVLAASAVAAVTLFATLSGNLVAPHLFGTTAAAVETGNPAVDLTVKVGDLLPDAAKCTTGDALSPNSLPHTPGRLWTESVSTPFSATSTDAQFKELVSEICVNPTLGDAYAQALGDATIGDFSVADANPWLTAMLKQSSTDMLGWLTFKVDSAGSYIMTGAGEDAEKAKFVTAGYQSDAELVNTLLYVLDNQGTKTATSTANWPLDALVGGNQPRVHKVTDPNGQENLPFMALTYTLKNGRCPFALGVNLKDKRAEAFPCETARTITPSVPTQSKPPTITPATPTKPGHKPTPSTPSGPPSTTPTSPPATCVWSNGTVHNLDHGVCPKDPNPLQTNPYHTPAASPSGPAKPPVHPSETANPSTTPGSGSTQTAPGASKPPTPSTPAPSVGPTGTATGCVNPITHQSC